MFYKKTYFQIVSKGISHFEPELKTQIRERKYAESSIKEKFAAVSKEGHADGFQMYEWSLHNRFSLKMCKC